MGLFAAIAYYRRHTRFLDGVANAHKNLNIYNVSDKTALHRGKTIENAY